MDDAASRVDGDLSLPQIRQAAIPTVADQVFAALQQRILTLELPPRTKLSEAEVARRMGVSRQPVREAFKRLSQLGYLQIRPQSGTMVSLISEEAVLHARFIRIALEDKTCRLACETLSDAALEDLRRLLELQKSAIDAKDRDRFYVLDDRFHRDICVQAGVGFVWELIRENKGHMDRIRMLALDMATQQQALQEHTAILDAIAARDPDAASAAIDQHLSRILVQIERVRKLDHRWFEAVRE